MFLFFVCSTLQCSPIPLSSFFFLFVFHLQPSNTVSSLVPGVPSLTCYLVHSTRGEATMTGRVGAETSEGTGEETIGYRRAFGGLSRWVAEAVPRLVHWRIRRGILHFGRSWFWDHNLLDEQPDKQEMLALTVPYSEKSTGRYINVWHITRRLSSDSGELIGPWFILCQLHRRLTVALGTLQIDPWFGGQAWRRSWCGERDDLVSSVRLTTARCRMPAWFCDGVKLLAVGWKFSFTYLFGGGALHFLLTFIFSHSTISFPSILHSNTVVNF